MDTKEKKRRAARPGSAGRSGGGNTAARDRRRTQADRRRQRPANEQKRVVRPPREDIPEVVYTSPKPVRRGRLALKLMSVAAVVAAVFMALSLFFRVETVMVAGAVQYTPWMVREASGISEGDSLLGISEPRIASRIIENLPYVDDVKISVNLPGTVNIEITELQVVYAIQASDGAWWLVSSGGRAIEKTGSAGSYTRITGLKLAPPEKDSQIQAAAESTGETVPTEGTVPTNPVPIGDQQTADAKLQTVMHIMQCLEASRIIGEVSVIDITDETEILLKFGQQMTVRLGDETRMDYKIAYMAAALEQLGESAGGEIDLTLEYTEEALFTPAG